MEVDPNSLDPELRMSKWYAIASAALGLLSLCGGVVPSCGGSMGLLGILLGFFSLKAERNRTAIAGMAISALGMLIAVIYTIILVTSEN